MNKIRKQRESERAWRKRELQLSRAYHTRLRRERKEREQLETGDGIDGYPGEGQRKASPVER